MRLVNRRIAILAAVTAAVAAVLAAKHLRRQEGAASPAGPTQRPGRPALYLFLDERDHDAGCERVYAAFERAKAGLPAGVDASRVDAERDPALAKRLGVRMLPTILLVDTEGAVAGRIEGEGDEVDGKLRELVSRLPKPR